MSLKWEAEFDNIFDEAVKAGLTAASVDIQYEAIEKVPWKTGDLSGSITFKMPKKKGTTWVSVIGANKEYAVWVEFGTGKHAEGGEGRSTPWAYEDPETGDTIWTAGSSAQPFMRPAFDNVDVPSVFGIGFRGYLRKSIRGNLKEV